MGFYDYKTAYNTGKLSDFLYKKAQVFDRDGVAGLSRMEYEQFQKWFTKNDIETYGLDIIEISRDERKAYRHSQIVPENIDKSDNVTEQEKKNLKRALNTTIGGVTVAGVGITTAITAQALAGVEVATLAGGLGFATGGLGLIVALLGTGGYYLYKNHLENKAEEQQKSEGS